MMVRRLILILWALGSLAAGGAVPFTWRYPPDCTTHEDRLRFAYRAQEKLRIEHNRRGAAWKAETVTRQEFFRWREVRFKPLNRMLAGEILAYRDRVIVLKPDGSNQQAYDQAKADCKAYAAFDAREEMLAFEDEAKAEPTAETLGWLYDVPWGAPPVGYEDIENDYTERDDDGETSASTDRATFTAFETQQNSAWWAKSHGAGHFTDFEIYCLSYNTSYGDLNTHFVVIAVDAAARDNRARDIANVGISINWGGSAQALSIKDWSDGSTDSYSGDMTAEDYGIQFERSSTTATAEIYSDDSWGSLLDTLTTAVPTTAFEYLIVGGGYDRNMYDDAALYSGYVEHVDLNEAAGGGGIIGFPHHQRMRSQ